MTHAGCIDHAHRFLSFIFRKNEIVELRAALGDRMVSGRHADLAKLAYNAVAMQAKHGASACYFGTNPIDRDSRLIKWHGITNTLLADVKQAAGNGDVANRATLLIDVDPARPSGVCSTDAEKAAAHEVLTRTIAYLSARGWPEPVLVDSGNGYHAYYMVNRLRKDLPAWPYLLKALGQMFDSYDAKIDISVGNPGRIARLPGTWNRKGPDTPERPHRLARVLSYPPQWQAVEHGSMILPLAREHGYIPPDERVISRPRELVIDEDGVLQLIAEYPGELELGGTQRKDGRTYFYLRHCPWVDRRHRDQGCKTAIVLGETLGFSCFSDECTDATMGALLRRLEQRTGHKRETPIWETHELTWQMYLKWGMIDEAAAYAQEADDYDEDEWDALLAEDEDEDEEDEDEEVLAMEETTAAPEPMTPAQKYDDETKAYLRSIDWQDTTLTSSPAHWNLSPDEVWAHWFDTMHARITPEDKELAAECERIHAQRDVAAMTEMIGVTGMFEAARAKERASMYPTEEDDRVATVAQAALILGAKVTAPGWRLQCER